MAELLLAGSEGQGVSHALGPHIVPSRKAGECGSGNSGWSKDQKRSGWSEMKWGAALDHR